MDAFSSFSSWMIVIRSFNTISNWSGECGYSYLIPDFKERLSNFHCSVWCYLWVFCKWTYVEIFSPVSIDSVLLWIDIEVCQIQIIEAFSASMEMDMWFLSFLLLMWVITVIDLWIWNHTIIPGINPIQLSYVILSIYCWNCLASILLNIFSSIVIKNKHLFFLILFYF